MTVRAWAWSLRTPSTASDASPAGWSRQSFPGDALPPSEAEFLRAHISSVRACTTGRSAATLLPVVKSQELRIAAQEGVDTIDPTSWFCTRRRCPVIVGNILLYRDRAHMVPAWSRFIAPVLAGAIVPTVQR